MAATTFPRFLDLPKELQIEILEFAASPSADLDHRRGCSVYLFEFAKYGYRDHPNDPVNLKILGSVGRARQSLMRACRLSRQVALEMWKKDVEKESLEKIVNLHGVFIVDKGWDKGMVVARFERWIE